MVNVRIAFLFRGVDSVIFRLQSAVCKESFDSSFPNLSYMTLEKDVLKYNKRILNITIMIKSAKKKWIRRLEYNI